MKTKIAINGFGRIGRPSFKIALENPELEIVAINDLGELENLAYLLKYDSVFGVYSNSVKIKDNNLVVRGQEIKVFSEKEPEKLPWKELGVEVVLECTGVFTDFEGAEKHLKAGAKKVLISAPTKDDKIKTIVIGCNEKEITPQDNILSMASCTTNCIAPMIKVLEDNFGVEKSLMSTVHSYTSTQSLVDGPATKDFRRGRAAAENIAPSTTGAAIAATKALPSLENRFDGLAFRIPTPAGSISDVVVLLKKNSTVEEINLAFKKAEENELKGILRTTEEQLVSSDIVGDPSSCIIQLDLTKVIGGNLVKVVGWYDNEWGYSNRLVELAEIVGKMI